MNRTVLRVAAPAKINLFLHVGARRADGYHALQSLVCFSDAGDVLTFAEDSALSLSLDGPFAAALAPESDNLVLRAARLLAGRAGCAQGAAIALTKNLPVASGIGGGSADAAAALRGLVRLWDLTLSPASLREIALSLGSDVPVCLASMPALMEGRGEHVTPVGALPSAAMVLVNPGVAVSTAEVFRRLGRTASDEIMSSPSPPAAGWSDLDDLLRYLSRTRNDMEAAALAIAPEIGSVLAALRAHGALLARMCGSGATCYGLFESDAAAAKAADTILSANPQWWAVATRIAGSGVVGS